uniref:Uncharacterized protein n=1 Tax=Knipowitschia caucasica TaxID=637954 RepID=A0AAV2M163_KNICA
MFCISLYARSTFRRLEPCLSDHTQVRCGGHVDEKSVQTDDWDQVRGPNMDQARGSAARARLPSGDILCRIEHAPLETFTFPRNMLKPGEDSGASSTEMEAESASVTIV